MIDIQRIRELSQRQSREHNIGLLGRAGKLTEEVGELWQEILAYEHVQNYSASASGTADKVVEEAVDVLINCFDILDMLGADDELINRVLRIKTQKWERKLNERKPISTAGLPQKKISYTWT